jgi:hypothetical protein
MNMGGDINIVIDINHKKYYMYNIVNNILYFDKNRGDLQISVDYFLFFGGGI